MELLTDRPEGRFTVGTALYIEGTDRTLTISDASAVADGPGWWLNFREIPSREAADGLRDLYLEIDAPVEEREPGRWFFHELEGLAVRATTGEELGSIVEIYRAGGAEVFVVRGPRGEIDIPGVKGIVTDLAPDRGEMIVDLEALDMDARPVDDEDYVRPRDRRPQKQVKPKGPAQPPKGTGPVRKPGAPTAATGSGDRTRASGEPMADDPTAAKPTKAAKAPRDAKGSRTLTPAEIEAALNPAAAPKAKRERKPKPVAKPQPPTTPGE